MKKQDDNTPAVGDKLYGVNIAPRLGGLRMVEFTVVDIESPSCLLLRVT